MAVAIVDPYPNWYTPLKWLIPLALSLSAGIGMGLLILNVVSVPVAFGQLAWLPALYASMTGMKALTFLALSCGLVGTFTGVISAFLLRSTVLFFMNEYRGTQGQKAQERINELEDTIAQMAEARNAMEQEMRLLQHQVHNNELQNKNVHFQYPNFNDSQKTTVNLEPTQNINTPVQTKQGLS
ncbi:MAG TPA: hypothetical protein VFP93_04505 [Gammaproteobacteria bacterium]|nr:hypothetical protein [Gammaproteobacteria bacterium]